MTKAQEIHTEILQRGHYILLFHTCVHLLLGSFYISSIFFLACANRVYSKLVSEDCRPYSRHTRYLGFRSAQISLAALPLPTGSYTCVFSFMNAPGSLHQFADAATAQVRGLTRWVQVAAPTCLKQDQHSLPTSTTNRH